MNIEKMAKAKVTQQSYFNAYNVLLQDSVSFIVLTYNVVYISIALTYCCLLHSDSS